MNELEHFLKTATRGLWGQKKLEVREELENHVLEQARKLELQGFKQTDAIQKVLEQIGPPQIVSSGMIGVHTMPNVIRSSLLAAALLTGTMTLLSSSIAQVSVSAILGQDNAVFRLFLKVDSFASTLQEAGFKVTKSTQGLEITLNEKRAYIPWTEFNSREVLGQRELDIHNAFGALQRAGIRIEQVNNLEKLTFRMNGKDITLDTNSVIARNWNLAWAKRWAFSYLVTRQNPIGGNMRFMESTAPADAFLEGKRSDLAGKFITVIAFRQGPGKTGLLRHAAIQQVEANGYFQVPLPVGSYLVATQDKTGFQKRDGNLELTQPNKGVLIVSVRQPDWVISATQSHQFVHFNSKEITLKPGQWSGLK
jgi:hypothetical protein